MFFYVSILAEATPKTLMRVMGVPGLTLYHLKSHLQAFSVFILCIILIARQDYKCIGEPIAEI